MNQTPEPVDYVTVPLKDGGVRVRLDRLTDGRVMCCLCFDYVTRDQLTPVPDQPGVVTDVCLPCNQGETDGPHR